MGGMPRMGWPPLTLVHVGNGQVLVEKNLNIKK